MRMRLRMKRKIVVSGKWQVKSRAQRLVAISFLLPISYFLLLHFPLLPMPRSKRFLKLATLLPALLFIVLRVRINTLG